MIVFIALATLIAIFLGGVFALKFSDKLHLILGFSAGAVIGVAFFDLLPEAIELAGTQHEISGITSVVALGFVIFMILDRIVVAVGESELDPSLGDSHGHHHTGRLGASALIVHSLLDGLAIGLAFQVSATVGTILAVAVIVHGFSDGINTVGLVLRDTANKKKAFTWLTADAIAPVVGIFLGGQFVLPQAQLGLLLSLFCGFFFYIGAADLLPESHHRHPKPWTTVSTIFGMTVIFIAISLAG